MMKVIISRRNREVTRKVGLIYGKYYPVEANILEIEAVSSCRSKGLLNWLSEWKTNLKVFLVHGENSR
jgi:hypothetical protein